MAEPFHPTKSSYWTPLHIAICHGHTSTARLLISQNASLNVVQPGTVPTTALHSAAAANNVEIIWYLVSEEPVDINSLDGWGYTSLCAASLRSDDLSALECLLELGADIKLSPENDTDASTLAANGAYFKAAKRIAECGTERPLVMAALVYALRLLEDFYGTEEHFPDGFDEKAWFADRDAALRTFLNIGAGHENLDDLMDHARVTFCHRNLGIVGMLLDFGVDVMWKGAMGETMLHQALKGTLCEHMVILLLQHGAKLDADDFSLTTPLGIVLDITCNTGSNLLLDTVLRHTTPDNCSAEALDDLALEAHARGAHHTCLALVHRRAALQQQLTQAKT